MIAPAVYAVRTFPARGHCWRWCRLELPGATDGDANRPRTGIRGSLERETALCYSGLVWLTCPEAVPMLPVPPLCGAGEASTEAEMNRSRWISAAVVASLLIGGPLAPATVMAQ